LLLSSTINRIRPELEPASSANSATIGATATATLAPLKKLGSAVGASTRRKIAQREASSVRIIFTASGSTERSPSSVVTVIGKKQASATTITFGQIP
jgi:hypothetical protein